MASLCLPVELKLKVIAYLQSDDTRDAWKALLALCRVWRDTSTTIQNHLWQTLTIRAISIPIRSISNLQEAFRTPRGRELISTVANVVLQDVHSSGPAPPVEWAGIPLHELSQALARSHSSFLYNFSRLQSLELSGIAFDIIPPKKTFYHALKRISLTSLDIHDCSLTIPHLYALLYSTASDLRVLRMSGNTAIALRPKFDWEREYGIDMAILRGLFLDELVLDMRTPGDHVLCVALGREFDPPIEQSKRLSIQSVEQANMDGLKTLIQRRSIEDLDLSELRSPIPEALDGLYTVSLRRIFLPIWLTNWSLDKSQIGWYINTFAKLALDPHMLRRLTIDVCIRLSTSSAVNAPDIANVEEHNLFQRLDQTIFSSDIPSFKLRIHVDNASPLSDWDVKRKMDEYFGWIVNTCLPKTGALILVCAAASVDDDIPPYYSDFDPRYFGWLTTRT